MVSEKMTDKFVHKQRKPKVIPLPSARTADSNPNYLEHVNSNQTTSTSTITATPSTEQSNVSSGKQEINPHESKNNNANENEQQNNNENDENDDSENDSENDEGEEDSKTVSNLPTSAEHKGTQILMDGLHLEGIGIAQCKVLKVIVVCERCKLHKEVSLSASLQWSAQCEKCHHLMVATFRSNQFFDNSAVLGYVDLVDCYPFLLGTENLFATCLSCSVEAHFKEVSMHDNVVSQNCLNCHKKLTITFKR